MLQNVPPIRLVALDLDGTLLNHEGKVTSRTQVALQAAADRGVAIVPTTGRPLGNLPPTKSCKASANAPLLCRFIPRWSLPRGSRLPKF